MEEHYKLTARDWASSPDPVEFAKAMREIHKFASNGDPLELLQRCNQLLYHNDVPTFPDCGLNLMTVQKLFFIFDAISNIELMFFILILHHLVSTRWEGLSDEAKLSIFRSLPRLIDSAAIQSAWYTKSKMTILLCELIAKDVMSNWAKLVGAYAAYHSCDDIKATSTIIICLSEGITIPDDESGDGRSKAMKIQNWDWLMQVLYLLLEEHLEKFRTCQVAEFQKHYDLALLIANTASAYAQWGEVKNLVKDVGGRDLITSFKHLLGYHDFHPAAFTYLSEICLRAQSTDCDHDVWTRLFYFFLDQVKFIPLGHHFRETVCLTLYSIKKTLGADFDHCVKDIDSLLEELKAEGSITYGEYSDFREKLCD